MGLGDLDLTTFDFTDTDAVKAALSEGQTAYKEVGKLRGKNTEVIGEKKAALDRLTAAEEKLKAKGLSFDTLDTFDPGATSEETLKKFQAQIDSERTTYASKSAELAAKLEAATREQSVLSERLQQQQIRQHYAAAAKVAGVDPDFTDDYFSILLSRGVEMKIDPESGEVRGKRPNDVLDYSLDTLLTNFKADPTHQKYYAGKFGGGSGTNPNGGKSGTANPFHPDTINLTEQGRIYRENPARAMELQKLAGS